MDPSDELRLLVHGASGRMGQALLRLGRDVPGCRVVAGVSGGRPGQRVIDGIPQFAASELAGAPAFDVAIDFSLPGAFDRILALCAERGAALVSGTTGLDEAQFAALDGAATRIPCAWAANFSLGVAALSRLVEQAAAALPGWDCDIVETHHARKVDAPSGTALALGEVAAAAGAVPRYASLRAGDVVGEHLVQFTGTGERIELVHRASSRDVFARGALHAARQLHGRPPGRYGLRDLLTVPAHDDGTA